MQDLHLGTLTMKAPMAHHKLHCAQFAYDSRDNSVLVASVAGPQTAVKSFAAALNENMKLVITCQDFEINDDGYRTGVRNWVEFTRVPGGQGKYKCHMHRLGYNQVHCLAVVKDPRFMSCITEESLWQKLRSPMYTTPLLREWMPWLMGNLVADGLLMKLPAFQCQPGLLTVDDAGLDTYVSRGVGTGALSISQKECA